MHYLALATDYDGTLAHHGQVDESTIATLRRLLASGRQLLLVTGREVEELQAIFRHLELFQCVVAENGAVLFYPGSGEITALAAPPPPTFVRALQQRGVSPVALGRVVVATWDHHEKAVRESIRELRLELQVILNKGSLMVLPAGVDKGFGLMVALRALNLPPNRVVAVGDAENDDVLLTSCGCGVAVANALPDLKIQADLVTQTPHGLGVAELIDRILATDLADVPRKPRQQKNAAD